MSPQKASSGIEITSATMRGRTSHSTGLSPIVRMASTSWLTCMVPIWAVKALPERPATMMAVSRTPSSRNMPIPTASTVKVSAPNCLSCCTPW